MEGALQCLLGFAFRLQAAVRAGAGRRQQEEAWTQALRLDDSWRPLAAAMSDFEARAQQLQGLLQEAGGTGAPAELAGSLDYNSFWARQAARRERVAAAVAGAAAC